MKTLFTSLIGKCLLLVTFVLSAYISGATCSASFTYSGSGLTYTFTNTSTSSAGMGNVYYSWDFMDGGTSNLKDPVITFSSIGSRSVFLSIYDSSTHCSSWYIDTICIGGNCQAGFTMAASGLTVTFTNTSLNPFGDSTGMNFQWRFSDGTWDVIKHPVKTFSTPGWKYIFLMAIDGTTQCHSYATDSIYLSGTAAGCQASFSSIFITPQTIEFTNTSTNSNGTAAGLNYYWQFSDATTTTNPSPVKSFSSGMHWARLFISDSSTGCAATTLDTFMIKADSCQAFFNKTISGSTVTFTNSSTAGGTTTGFSSLWDFGDGTTSTATHPVKIYTANGIYPVTLFITDSFCSSSFTDTVLITGITPACSASFVLAVDTTTPFHFYLLNTSIITATSNFLWTFGDGDSSSLMTPSHNYANFGVYQICLTVYDSTCTSTYCDSIGMDSTGTLYKNGAFGFQVLNYTTLSTGTKELTMLPEYKLFPNPATDNINIEYTLSASTPITIKLIDMAGKELITKQTEGSIGSNKQVLELEEFKSGIYFLSIRTPQGLRNYKIVKH